MLVERGWVEEVVFVEQSEGENSLVLSHLDVFFFRKKVLVSVVSEDLNRG
jgi:hypothetical protein